VDLAVPGGLERGGEAPEARELVLQVVEPNNALCRYRTPNIDFIERTIETLLLDFHDICRISSLFNS
jgi:hypothetical protein